jgi:alkyl-hydroperoxide reductase/thiol specific antioxidant family protein
VNLRTFLPPAAHPTAEPPAPGEAARRLPLPGRSGEGPAVIAFLRHTGCPFAEATLRALRDAAAAHPEIEWVAVSHAGPEATQRWCDAIGGRGEVEILLDVDRRCYAAWGLGRSSLSHFMGRRSLSEVARLARQGIRNRHPDGTRWQQAGTFAIDAADVVRWRHLPEHAGELPDLDEAAAAVRPEASAVRAAAG